MENSKVKSKKTIRIPRLGKADTTKILLSAIFISSVFIPLIRMLAYMDSDSIRRVLDSPNFGTAIKNSLVSSILSTVITVILAFTLALCIQRTGIKFKTVFSTIFMLPMLIPSISIGMGLTILFGNNGVITKLLSLNGNIYGLQGIVMGSVMYAFPVAYLMLADVIRYEDGSPYEAAKILGIPRWRQLKNIMFPYLRKPLISVVFSVFTLTITDYGVPLMVGGKYTTVASVMYQEVIGQLNFGKGAVYGSFLLIPAVIAFLIDLLNKDKGNSSYVTKPCAMSDSRILKAFAYVFSIVTVVFTFLPIFAFILQAFTTDYPNNLSFTLDNVSHALRLRADEYLINSIIIALCTATLGVIIAFLTAYLSARMKSKTSRFLHLSAMTSAAIPGVVLGLSYVLTFNTTPIYGTLIILIMVNIVHFIASPYLMMYNSLSKINENLESVASTMAISRMHMIKDVFIPQCKFTLLEMFSYFFVNCMMTISAVSFLATTMNKPVSLMINQFEAQMQLEEAAVVSLMILLVNLIIKLVVYVIKGISNRKIVSK